MFSDEFDLELNDSFEDGSIFTFEKDNRTLKDVAPITNSSRFATVSSQGIQDIITNSKAKSTRKNTNWAMNTFRGRARSSRSSTTFRNSFFVLGYSLFKFKIISMFSFQVLDNTHS